MYAHTVAHATAPRSTRPSDLLRETPNKSEEHAWPSESRGPAPNFTKAG